MRRVFAILPAVLVAVSATAVHADTDRSHADEWSAAPVGYHLVQAIDVKGARGTRVELLEDDRFSARLRERWTDVGIDCFETPDDPELAELCTSALKEPLRGARIRLVSKTQGVLEDRVFGRERGHLAVADLYGPQRFLLSVMVDYSIGWGSYAGPVTTFVEPVGSNLRWFVAHDVSAGTAKERWFIQSLKHGWETAPRPGGRDILAIHCAPDFEHAPSDPDADLPFVVRYERYHFDGARWLVTSREEPGFWENEVGLPPEERFPEVAPPRSPANR